MTLAFEHLRPHWFAPPRKPLRNLLVLSAALFIAEWAVMEGLKLVPHLPPWAVGVIDAAVLLVLALPAIYYCVLQPALREADERHRIETQLRMLARATSVSELAASVTHELRQPLAAINANAEAAERFLGQQPPNLAEVRDALRDVLASTDRASDVIDRLRALYCRTGEEHRAVSVNELIDETVALMRRDLMQRGVACRTDLDPALGPARANRVEIQQVVMNLVLNAAEAMAEIEPDRRCVLVSTRPMGASELLVAVRDFGIGFPPADARQLFEPFYTTKPAGLGIGLTVCRTIVEGHGGELWCTNNPDHGATFQFTLPLLR